MYAVIRTGGKQYRVSQDDVLRVESLGAEVGSTVSLDVLAIGNEGDIRLGTPLVEGAKVNAKVVSNGRAKKVLIFKFRRRKNYRLKKGHRQNYSEIKISEIIA